MSLRVVGPIGLDRIPEFLEPFFVGVAVLHDQSGDALRMFQGQAPSNRCAIVHDIHRVARDPELIEQATHQLTEAIERVGKLGAVGHVALPVTGIVRCDHVIAVGKRRDQVAEHVRRGRESVQQQHHRRRWRSSLPIEDVDAIDRLCPIVRDARGR